MKTKLIIVQILLYSIQTIAQVGIGTTNPNAVLDIRATNQIAPSNTDGILIPKVDDFPVVNPTASQDGMLIYITGNSTPSKGFYYWDNTLSQWISIATGNGDADWYEANTVTPSNNIFDGIYTMGNVGIGTSTPGSPLQIYTTSELPTLNMSKNLNTTLSTTGINNVIFQNGSGQTNASNTRIGGTGNASLINSYNLINNSGNGNHYGYFCDLSGSGTGGKFGIRSIINPSAGGTHYGIYSSALKSGSFAGFFEGNMIVNDGMVSFTDATLDANPNAGSGILELGGGMRLDANEIITGFGTTLYLQNDNQGDIRIDNNTLFLDGTNNTVTIGALTSNSRLDVQSTNVATPSNTDGLLIPKVDEFSAVNPTAQQDGMLVYATGNGSVIKGFYYWDNTLVIWVKLDTAIQSLIRDLDADTKVDVEQTPDDDIIRFHVQGQEYLSMFSTNSVFKMSLPNNNNNVLFGENSGSQLLSAAINNIAIGTNSMENNQNGRNNIAIGFNSLNDVVSNSNIAIGSNALANTASGNNNVAIGDNAMANSSSGQSNTTLGANTGDNTSGNNNVFIGYRAGSSTISQNNSNNVFIGYQAGMNLTVDDRLYIENTSSSIPLIGGDFLRNRVTINRDPNMAVNALEVNGNASKSVTGSWLANSDERLKKEIHKIDGQSALNLLTQLNGISYYWNDKTTGIDRPKNKQYGFVAQNIQQVFPEKVSEDAHGFLQTSYGDYDAFFVEAIKELNKRLIEQSKQIEELKHEIEILKKLEDK